MTAAISNYVGWYGSPRRQDWRTPAYLFDPLNDEYGFDLDGAAEDGNALLPDASTPERPVPWAGRRVFCNPPWSSIAPFVEMAPEAAVAVLLVPARVNARWFHRALELRASVRFFARRPSFANGEHVGRGHNSPVDCLLLVWGQPTSAEADLRTLRRSLPAIVGPGTAELWLAFRRIEQTLCGRAVSEGDAR